MSSDAATHSWFVAVQYRSNKVAFDRLKQLPAEVVLAAQKSNTHLRYAAVDARRSVSASNIKPVSND